MTPGKSAVMETAARQKQSSISPADPCTIVIFGASGDLSRRKLVPALYGLAAQNCLARRFAIIGFSPHTHDRRGVSEIGDRFGKEVRGRQTRCGKRSARNLQMHSLMSRANIMIRWAFEKLKKRLEDLDQAHNLNGNRLFTSPLLRTSIPELSTSFDKAGLAKHPNGKSWTRIIIEKPFRPRPGIGAKAESERTQSIRRISGLPHRSLPGEGYGTKPHGAAVWQRHIRAVVEPELRGPRANHRGETLGVEQRAAFYETAGATRDMIQSHVLQLTSLVAMEPPAAFDATAVRNEKIKFCNRSGRLLPKHQTNIVRGQYGPGKAPGNPSTLPGYRDEPGVAKESATETFVAASLQIDNWRWAGVPFYLRTGKRLPSRVTEIANPVPARAAPGISRAGFIHECPGAEYSAR